MRRPVLLALCLALSALAGCDVLNPMMSQQKLKPYRPSDFFPDGISMRPPPAGAVPAGGWQPSSLAAGTGDDGQLVERMPVRPTPELLALGRKRFDVNCAVCHGLLADGDSLVARNMSQRPPPSLHQRVRADDGFYFNVISRGFGVMPSYAGALTPEERWAGVADVRALQLGHQGKLDQVPPEQRAKLERERRETPR